MSDPSIDYAIIYSLMVWIGVDCQILEKNAEIFSCVARGVDNHALPGPEACLNLTIHFTLIST